MEEGRRPRSPAWTEDQTEPGTSRKRTERGPGRVRLRQEEETILQLLVKYQRNKSKTKESSESNAGITTLIEILRVKHTVFIKNSHKRRLTQSPGRQHFQVGLIGLDGVHVHGMDEAFCQAPPQKDPP